jgi:hypothetical protein
MTTLHIRQALMTGAKSLRLIAVGAVAVVGLVGADFGAKAVAYTLTDVTLADGGQKYTLSAPLSDGGLLSGTFTIDFGGVFDYSLTTTGGSAGLDTFYTYPGFPAPNSIPFGNPTVLQLFPVSFTAMLQLTFSSDLTVAGPHLLLGGIGGPSFECNSSFSCPADIAGDYPIRYVEGTTAVPEPPALVLIVSGLVLLGYLSRRKRAIYTPEAT